MMKAPMIAEAMGRPMAEMGHSLPKEAIDFESALTSTPDTSPQRTK